MKKEMDAAFMEREHIYIVREHMYRVTYILVKYSHERGDGCCVFGSKTTAAVRDLFQNQKRPILVPKEEMDVALMKAKQQLQ